MPTTLTRPPAKPLTKRTVSDALDRATAHLVRAEWQYSIPGPRQRDHWERAIAHLAETRGALEEAMAVLQVTYATLYGPLGPPKSKRKA